MCEFYLILNPGMNIGSMGMNKIKDVQRSDEDSKWG
jgi:hypothetical protein